MSIFSRPRGTLRGRLTLIAFQHFICILSVHALNLTKSKSIKKSKTMSKCEQSSLTLNFNTDHLNIDDEEIVNFLRTFLSLGLGEKEATLVFALSVCPVWSTKVRIR